MLTSASWFLMIYDSITPNLGFPNSSVGKSLQWRRPWFESWAGKIPWRRERLPTPVFWPGNSMDCTVCGVAKSWTWLSDFHFHFSLSTPNFETVYLLYSFAVANWIWTHLYLVTTKAETMISLILPQSTQLTQKTDEILLESGNIFLFLHILFK